MGVCGETFKNGVGALNNSNKQEQLNCQRNFGTCLLVLVLMLLINFVLGPWLWNNVLTKCVTVVKPIDSFIQFLGLYVLIMILFSN